MWKKKLHEQKYQNANSDCLQVGDTWIFFPFLYPPSFHLGKSTSLLCFPVQLSAWRWFIKGQTRNPTGAVQVSDRCVLSEGSHPHFLTWLSTGKRWPHLIFTLNISDKLREQAHRSHRADTVQEHKPYICTFNQIKTPVTPAFFQVLSLSDQAWFLLLQPLPRYGWEQGSRVPGVTSHPHWGPLTCVTVWIRTWKFYSSLQTGPLKA